MKNGMLIEYGDKIWYLNDKFHRVDGPAIEAANGNRAWFVNGQRHRRYGPAIEYLNGDKVWYRNGQYHRTDGPAIEYANGSQKWWYNNMEESRFTNRARELLHIINSLNIRGWLPIQTSRGRFPLVSLIIHYS
jgi:hypothetical protein